MPTDPPAAPAAAPTTTLLGDPFEPFDCDRCGAAVQLAVAAGRTTRDRRPRPIPAWAPLATCIRCGERYLSEAEAAALTAAIEAESKAGSPTG